MFTQNLIGMFVSTIVIIFLVEFPMSIAGGIVKILSVVLVIPVVSVVFIVLV